MSAIILSKNDKKAEVQVYAKKDIRKSSLYPGPMEPQNIVEYRSGKSRIWSQGMLVVMDNRKPASEMEEQVLSPYRSKYQNMGTEFLRSWEECHPIEPEAPGKPKKTDKKAQPAKKGKSVPERSTMGKTVEEDVQDESQSSGGVVPVLAKSHSVDSGKSTVSAKQKPRKYSDKNQEVGPTSSTTSSIPQPVKHRISEAEDRKKRPADQSGTTEPKPKVAKLSATSRKSPKSQSAAMKAVAEYQSGTAAQRAAFTTNQELVMWRAMTDLNYANDFRLALDVDERKDLDVRFVSRIDHYRLQEDNKEIRARTNQLEAEILTFKQVIEDLTANTINLADPVIAAMVGFDEGKKTSMIGSGLRKTFGFKDIVARCTTIQGAKRSKKPALDPLKMESLRLRVLQVCRHRSWPLVSTAEFKLAVKTSSDYIKSKAKKEAERLGIHVEEVELSEWNDDTDNCEDVGITDSEAENDDKEEYELDQHVYTQASPIASSKESEKEESSTEEELED